MKGPETMVSKHVILWGALAFFVAGGANAQDFEYTAVSQEIIFDADTGEAEFVGQIQGIETSDDDSETEGFQLSAAFDTDILIGSDPRLGPDIEVINDGDGPDFSSVNLSDDEDGVVAGVVYSLLGGSDLIWDTAITLIEIDFETTETFFDEIDEFEGGESTFDLVENLSLNGISIDDVVVVGGMSYYPTLTNGTFTFTPEETRLSFLRGDVNGSGTVGSLLDALDLMTWAFADGDEPPCLAAADCDGSGSVSALLDSLYLLNWGFSDGDAPPDPGPDECGVDPNDVECLEEADACA